MAMTSLAIHSFSICRHESVAIGHHRSFVWFRETIASVSEFYPLVSVISFIRPPFDWNNLIDVRRSRFGKSALLFRLDQFSLVNSSIAIVPHHLYIDMVPLVYRSGELALSVGFRNFFLSCSLSNGTNSIDVCRSHTSAILRCDLAWVNFLVTRRCALIAIAHHDLFDWMVILQLLG